MSPLSAVQPALSSELRNFALPKASLGPMKATAYPELSSLGSLPSPGTPSLNPASESQAFASTLNQLISDVNAKQAASGQAMAGLLSGQNVSLHQAMIAAEEASVSFQLMVEVRNKLLEAYQEMMRMQV